MPAPAMGMTSQWTNNSAVNRPRNMAFIVEDRRSNRHVRAAELACAVACTAGWAAGLPAMARCSGVNGPARARGAVSPNEYTPGKRPVHYPNACRAEPVGSARSLAGAASGSLVEGEPGVVVETDGDRIPGDELARE